MDKIQLDPNSVIKTSTSRQVKLADMMALLRMRVKKLSDNCSGGQLRGAHSSMTGQAIGKCSSWPKP